MGGWLKGMAERVCVCVCAQQVHAAHWLHIPVVTYFVLHTNIYASFLETTPTCYIHWSYRFSATHLILQINDKWSWCSKKQILLQGFPQHIRFFFLHAAHLDAELGLWGGFWHRP